MQVGTARAAAGLHGDPLAHRGDPPRQHEGVDAGQLAVGYRAIEALGELAGATIFSQDLNCSTSRAVKCSPASRYR
jgi:hypothetical protein